MRTLINELRKSGLSGLFVLGALAMSLNARGQTICCNGPVGYIAGAATYLLTATLTTEQVQTLHAQTFNQLPPSLRPLYVHAVAFQIGAIVAVGAPVPEPVLADYLATVDLDAFFDVFFDILPDEDEAIIIAGLREVNLLIANQISASPALQQAIRSGAVNGFNFPGGDARVVVDGPSSIATQSSSGTGHYTLPGTGSVVDDTLEGL